VTPNCRLVTLTSCGQRFQDSLQVDQALGRHRPLCRWSCPEHCQSGSTPNLLYPCVVQRELFAVIVTLRLLAISGVSEQTYLESWRGTWFARASASEGPNVPMAVWDDSASNV
jgi:hypothetical protein